MIWVIYALLLFIFQIMTILILEFRRPGKAIAWLLVLFIFPLIGFVMYYFLAQEYKKRKIIRKKVKWRVYGADAETANPRGIGVNVAQISNPSWKMQDHLFGLLESMPEAPITLRNDATVLTNAESAYAAMMEAMKQAKHHIHLESYIIRSDQTGRAFQNILMKKAREGVIVRLIFDGVGSYKLEAKYIAELKEAGVQVFAFLPPFIAFFHKRFNYRNHRKIIVVDGLVGFVGGINIGDEYLGANKRLGFWRDSHICIRGDAVQSLQKTFLTDWLFVSAERILDNVYYPAYEGDGREEIQIITSGPDAHWDPILEVYFSAINSAKTRLYLTTPYFIPGSSIMMALKTAALSGVDVRVIIPGVADSNVVLLASLSFMNDLLDAGVKFYRYQKGFIHAKVLIVDDLLASIGTANVDMRSFYSNFEMNAVLFDRETIAYLVNDFEQDLVDSVQIDHAQFDQRSRIQKGKEIIARLLSPIF